MTEILFFNDEYKNLWDKYITSADHGSFYHLSAWKEVIEDTFRFKPFYLMALNNKEEFLGVLPLFLMKDIIGKKYLVSNPSSNFAGICANNIKVRADLFTKAKEIAITNNVQYIEIRQRDDIVDDLPSNNDYVTMHLPLNENEEALWNYSLNSKARNQVRKAYKMGLKVDFGKEYLDDFYQVLASNFRELGSPIYPKKFFSNILKKFNKATNILVVKLEEKVIGGMLFIRFNKTFSDPWAASLKQYNNLCPNNILYWEAIKHACKSKCTSFDMGRSTVNSGTFKFKKQWGATPVRLSYQYFLNNINTIPVSAGNARYNMAINIWKKLPLALTNTVGPRLIRYLPEI